MIPKNAPVSEEKLRKLLDSGHIGTHFDVMDKAWPFKSFRTNGKLFDVSHIQDREVEDTDLQGQTIEEGDTVILHTGLMKRMGYNAEYAMESANLSDAAIDYLIAKRISIIGVDANGAQKPAKHMWVDQRCSDNDVFIVENLDKMQPLLDHAPKPFVVYTAPVQRTDLSGLPCRMVVDLLQ